MNKIVLMSIGTLIVFNQLGILTRIKSAFQLLFLETCIRIFAFFFFLGNTKQHLQFFHKNLPPVVDEIEIIRSLAKYRRLIIYSLLKDLGEKYGGNGLFTVKTPLNTLIFVCDPDAVQRVMSDRECFVHRGVGAAAVPSLGLLGLPTNDMWTLHRRLLSKGFAEPALKQQCEVVKRDVTILLKKWARYMIKSEKMAENNNIIDILKDSDDKKAALTQRKLKNSNNNSDNSNTQPETTIANANANANNNNNNDDDDEAFRYGKNIIDIHLELMRLTFDVIGKVAFGHDFQTLTSKDSLAFRAFDTLIASAPLAIVIPRFIMLQFLPNAMKEFKWAKDYMTNTIVLSVETIKESLRSDPDAKKRIQSAKNPLLEGSMIQAMLSASAQEEKEKEKIAGVTAGKNTKRLISDLEVMHEAVTLLAAGHETTSNTASWALLLLAAHPDIQNWVREEVCNLLPQSKSGIYRYEVPNFQQWRKLERTTAVVLEALRLFPTVPTFPRQAEFDTTINGYDIPKGTMVFVLQSAMNLNGNIWKNPNDFIPSRFLPMSKSNSLSGFTQGTPDQQWGFLPFGAGPRMCLGRRLALMEATMMISALIANFQFDLSNGITIETVPGKSDVTYGPKFGLPLHVTALLPPPPPSSSSSSSSASKL